MHCLTDDWVAAAQNGSYVQHVWIFLSIIVTRQIVVVPVIGICYLPYSTQEATKSILFNVAYRV